MTSKEAQQILTDGNWIRPGKIGKATITELEPRVERVYEVSFEGTESKFEISQRGEIVTRVRRYKP